MFNNLHELIATMPDEKSCREYLVKQRWPDGKIICPHCGHEKCYVIENGKKFKCASKSCYKKFSVTVGTIFEASNIPLNKWFMAVYLCIAHKKGISSYQLGKDIGVSQKCAWFMLHRIRELMRPKENVLLDNIVEIDEVYMGGKVSNMSKTKRTMLRETGMSMNTKTMVMGMIERGGSLKLITIGKAFENMNKIDPAVRDNVDTDAVLITDSHASYGSLKNDYAGHEVIKHDQQEYVRDGVIHTNTIEGAFSLFKRSIYGIYHQCTPKHLSRYCDETSFRYNHRKMKDPARFNMSLTQTEGRLKWKDLTDKSNDTIESKMQITFEPKGMSIAPIGNANNKPVQQIKDGKVVATYISLKEAQHLTGITWQNISAVLNGKRKSTGGYQWKYL